MVFSSESVDVTLKSDFSYSVQEPLVVVLIMLYKAALTFDSKDGKFM